MSAIPRTLLSRSVLALSLTLGACEGEEVTPASTSELRGAFVTEGYGYALEGDGKNVTLYEVTDRSCVPAYTGVANGLDIPELDLKGSYENDRLVIRDSGTAMFVARPVTELPAPCANGGTKPTQDAVESFEIFQRTFAEQYAFFDLHQVNWEGLVTTYRSRVTSSTPSSELAGILCEMIKPLNDGHVGISFGDEYCSAEELPAAIVEHGDALEAYLLRLIGADGMKKALGGAISWGRLKPDVGYIMLLQMTGEGRRSSEHAESMAAVMDQVISELADAKHIIVDLRANGGGLDNVSLAIAARFADQGRDIYTKKARKGDGFTAERQFRVEPAGARQFTGDTIVLTSSLTASAAEIFVMAMRVLPHVTVIGERTSGGHSDILERNLPNGFTFGLSNEVYRAADGQIYEGVGVPPTVEVPFDPAAIANGTDRILDAALEHVAEH